MGTKARQKPERLAEKLVQIRTALGLSQNEMIKRLNAEDFMTQNIISNYERGKREPPLLILLQYARLAGVHMEALIDDELDLPENLPGTVKQKEIKSRYSSRPKSKR